MERLKCNTSYILRNKNITTTYKIHVFKFNIPIFINNYVNNNSYSYTSQAGIAIFAKFKARRTSHLCTRERRMLGLDRSADSRTDFRAKPKLSQTDEECARRLIRTRSDVQLASSVNRSWTNPTELVRYRNEFVTLQSKYIFAAQVTKISSFKIVRCSFFLLFFFVSFPSFFLFFFFIKSNDASDDTRSLILLENSDRSGTKRNEADENYLNSLWRERRLTDSCKRRAINRQPEGQRRRGKKMNVKSELGIVSLKFQA